MPPRLIGSRLDHLERLVREDGTHGRRLRAATDPDAAGTLAALEATPERWLRQLFARYLSAPDGTPIPFAPHQLDVWEWVWSLRRGVRPRPFVGIWARGAGKSSSAELACVALGARGTRKYGWYVSSSQSQADDHVGNVGGMLESRAVEEHYPGLAARRVGKYGNAAGWRRNRLRTAAGFTIDALGLDVAVRGVKLDEDRPDFLVADDLDVETDSAATTAKKVMILTRKVLPAGAADLAVLGIQNLVIPTGIFAQIADGRADFLRNRILSGPVPAVRDLEVEQTEDGYVIVGGTPTWAGQALPRCQEQINEWGLSAFLAEAQHEVDAPPGGMFDHLEFRRCAWDAVPWGDLTATTVWVDPAVTNTDRSDAMGIQVDGLARDGTIYRLYSWEQRASPLEALKRALRLAVEYKSHMVGVETDQGGDTWRTVYRAAWRELVESGEIEAKTPRPRFMEEKAGAGDGPKVHRASQMLAEYERSGRFVHVMGTHTVLERALRRFPLTRPLDLVDACYWSYKYLNQFRKVDRTASSPIIMSGGVPVGGRDRSRAPAHAPIAAGNGWVSDGRPPGRRRQSTPVRMG